MRGQCGLHDVMTYFNGCANAGVVDIEMSDPENAMNIMWRKPYLRLMPIILNDETVER